MFTDATHFRDLSEHLCRGEHSNVVAQLLSVFSQVP